VYLQDCPVDELTAEQRRPLAKLVQLSADFIKIGVKKLVFVFELRSVCDGRPFASYFAPLSWNDDKAD